MQKNPQKNSQIKLVDSPAASSVREIAGKTSTSKDLQADLPANPAVLFKNQVTRTKFFERLDKLVAEAAEAYQASGDETARETAILLSAAAEPTTTDPRIAAMREKLLATAMAILLARREFSQVLDEDIRALLMVEAIEKKLTLPSEESIAQVRRGDPDQDAGRIGSGPGLNERIARQEILREVKIAAIGAVKQLCFRPANADRMSRLELAVTNVVNDNFDQVMAMEATSPHEDKVRRRARHMAAMVYEIGLRQSGFTGPEAAERIRGLFQPRIIGAAARRARTAISVASGSEPGETK
jgi:hypothetical protein